MAVVRVPEAKVALSTASVYPESTASAFELAGRLGVDGVEVMVWTDPVSQDPDALRRLADYHQVPVVAGHAPCLLITQRAWGNDPGAKLVRAREVVTGIHRMANGTDVRFAVENMFPLRAGNREITPYTPDWDVVAEEYRHFTLDLSHTSVS